PWFLDYIRRNPFLQPYLAPPNAQDGGQFDEKCPRTPLSKILDSIYLDTASVLSTTVVPAKSDATQGLVSLMALFPHQTTFFITHGHGAMKTFFALLLVPFKARSTSIVTSIQSTLTLRTPFCTP
ncbi:hypothetical protein BGW80DRAFT_1541847, partial [Lactifluus volemus]